MELVAVFLADDAGMNDSGAMRLDGGYLGWLPRHVVSDDREDDLAYALVILGRGRPVTADLRITVTSDADRPVVHEDTLPPMPNEDLWWVAMNFPAKALANAPGPHRVEAELVVDGAVVSSAWCGYVVR